ncbi:MAG TPA: hypothetical protein DD827_01710 [Gammaproteobacteria bacterium]|jgi:HAD superfamily hydrolase (TIGR01490 family)|nr:hypothetical protein [Gammaproteobacteria bacterium]
MKTETAAVFDFDGTLTKRDTLFPMALFFARNRHVISFLKYCFYYGLFKFGLISNESLKIRFAACFFKGKGIEEIQDLLLVFVNKQLSLREEVYNAFKEHLNKGDKTIIVSANFDVVVESWLKSVNADIDAVAATKLHVHAGVYTGALEGAVCRGKNKAERLQAQIDISNYHIISYADEVSDVAIMNLANKQVWVGNGING